MYKPPGPYILLQQLARYLVAILLQMVDTVFQVEEDKAFGFDERIPIGTTVRFYCRQLYYIVNTTSINVNGVSNASGEWSVATPRCTYGGIHLAVRLPPDNLD